MPFDLFPGGVAGAFATYGYLGFFLVIFLQELGAPIPMPGHGVLLFAGYLAFEGTFQLEWVFAIGVVAAVSGATVLYTLSRFGGRPLIRRCGRWIRVNESRIDSAEHHFRRRRRLFIPASRLLPGTKIYGSALSGAFAVPYRQFFLLTLAASVLWVGGMTFAGSALKGNTSLLLSLMPVISVTGALIVAGPLLWSRFRGRVSPALAYVRVRRD